MYSSFFRISKQTTQHDQEWQKRTVGRKPRECRCVDAELGFGTQAGRLIECFKQLGDPTMKGELITIIGSDKANVELEALASRILFEQGVQPDKEIANGAALIAYSAARR
jgi:hypothetical protein